MKYPKQNRPIPKGMIGYNGFNSSTIEVNSVRKMLIYFIDYSCLHGIRFLGKNFPKLDR